MMKKLLFTCCLLLVFLSCNNSDEDTKLDSVCDQMAIVDKSLYNNGESESFSIQSINLIGDCLEVGIQSGGCDGENWEVKLVDSGNIAESNPAQRYIKVLLDNEELCEALILQTYTFDLKPIQTGNNVVLLNLEQWEEQIRYEF